MRSPMLSLCSLAVLPGAARAISLDRNRLDTVDDGYRAYLAAKAADAVDPLTLDLVLFDAEGLIRQCLDVEAGPVPAGRPVVRAVVIEETDCDAKAPVLLDDILACLLADCRDAISVGARREVESLD